MIDRDILLARRYQRAISEMTFPTGIPTPRECDVLYWATHGKTDREIGAMLGISVSTVRNHMRNIIHKLAAANRTHAVALALHRGLVTF